MRKKSLVSSILVVFTLFTIASSVSANSLGNLTYWYSDGSQISRWQFKPQHWSGTVDSSFDANNLNTYIGHAKS